MARRPLRPQEAELKPNAHCPSEREINILLLGQTGVGKSTFINAFANYIVNDALTDAVNDEMQIIIPSSFSHTMQDTFDEKTIKLGSPDEYEMYSLEGESATQQCRSFVFPVGDRNLRLIDTPGVGDTRGLDQDAKNFQEILTYIAQFEHVNGVCILFKPDQQRLDVVFRFCINELLRHLHNDARHNIMFVFTNSRQTFYMPGSSKKLIDGFLKKHREEHGIDLTLSRDNTFLFDNEPFRYLALRKNDIELNDDQTQSYIKSWDHSVKEYGRLMEQIVSRPLHAVSNTVSLNEAEQLVRKLPRPIAETAKLIEENIQLAKVHKKKVLDNPEIALQGIPQNNASVKELAYPRTVCTGKNCCRIIKNDDDMKIEYIKICHDRCYLKGVVQETLNDPNLADCEAMDPTSGRCTECGCNWGQHRHITYEYKHNRTHVNSRSSGNKEMSLRDIDKRISDLREEQRQIQDVYRKLAKFLFVNSILPVNDDIVEYLGYFIKEERLKQSAGAQNSDVIDGLEKMRDELVNNMERLKKTLQEEKDSGNMRDTIRPNEIFDLVGSLYELPITGQQIRDQVEGIKIGQARVGNQREKLIRLPSKAARSRVMVKMNEILSA